jgi:hypothetical protein
VAKVVHVDRELTLRLQAHNVAHGFHQRSIAASGQRHHSTLFEYLEAEVACDEGVDHSEAVKEAPMPATFDAIAPAREGARGGIVAIAVHDEDARLVEWRDKENRRVRFVMTHIDDWWHALTPELALEIEAQPKVQEDNAAILRRLRGL